MVAAAPLAEASQVETAEMGNGAAASVELVVAVRTLAAEGQQALAVAVAEAAAAGLNKVALAAVAHKAQS